MERRKILLGSGAALTTALAGCTGSDSSDDDEESDDGTESITEGETESDDPEDTETDPDESDDPDGREETDGDDIPGFDASALSLESDAVTITSIERAGDTVEVVADSETTDYEELYAELESLVDDHEQAVTDLDAFADEIEAVEWVVDHDDMKVVSFTIEVAWLVDYREGDLSKEQFLSKVEATAE